MANMVIPDAGKILWLNWALITDGSDLEDFVLHLYSNNYNPVPATITSDFVECTFIGYDSLAIARTDFGAPAINAGAAVSVYDPAPEFTSTDPVGELAYGWYLTGADSDVTVASQRFTNARQMIAGSTELIDPFQIMLSQM